MEVRYFIPNKKCASETMFKMIASKWKPRIIYCCLENDHCSFTALMKYNSPISKTMLNTHVVFLIYDKLSHQPALIVEVDGSSSHQEGTL